MKYEVVVVVVLVVLCGVDDDLKEVFSESILQKLPFWLDSWTFG